VNRRRDRVFYEACIRHYGIWRGALIAAGVNLENVTRHRPGQLDREGMILWLRNRKASGQTLVYTEVYLENRDHVLAIKREFRS
jgi:hypothetical protein